MRNRNIIAGSPYDVEDVKESRILSRILSDIPSGIIEEQFILHAKARETALDNEAVMQMPGATIEGHPLVNTLLQGLASRFDTMDNKHSDLNKSVNEVSNDVREMSNNMREMANNMREIFNKFDSRFQAVETTLATLSSKIDETNERIKGVLATSRNEGRATFNMSLLIGRQETVTNGLWLHKENAGSGYQLAIDLELPAPHYFLPNSSIGTLPNHLEFPNPFVQFTPEQIFRLVEFYNFDFGIMAEDDTEQMCSKIHYCFRHGFAAPRVSSG